MKRKQQGGLLPVAKFREILRLHDLGYSQCQIAQSGAVAHSTENYIRRATAQKLSYAQLTQLSDSEAQAALGKGRQKREQQEEPIDFGRIDAELQHQDKSQQHKSLWLAWEPATTPTPKPHPRRNCGIG
ncbi:MAG: hypothetical protein HC879_01120 [Leptolyngbyaceae cyanobacterium SL_5_9]|nr:hypothetical protein [Leptolyngbyaceae cyanobacterium SL_5_9]